MADEAEIAADYQAKEEAFLLSRAQTAAKTRELHPKGRCYFCEETVDEIKLFCDIDCAQEFERLKKARSRNG